MACNCGGKTGSKVQYVAKANNGRTESFSDSPSARLFLASNGGGSVKAEPVK